MTPLLNDATRLSAARSIRDRNEAEAVKPPAVKQVHGVDYQRDVGGVLACRVCELLQGDDGVL